MHSFLCNAIYNSIYHAINTDLVHLFLNEVFTLFLAKLWQKLVPSFKLNIGWGRVSPFFSIHSFIHSSVCLFGRGRLMQWEVCLLSQNRV